MNKQVCKLCVHENRGINGYWTVEDDKLWTLGFVCCAFGDQSYLGITVKPFAEVMKVCPNVLEHEVLGQENNNEKYQGL